MHGFRYDSQIIERFPNIIGGVLLVRDAANAPSSDALKAAYQAEQQATLTRMGDTPLSKIESLSAWRKAFREFGVDPTQYRSAAEALLRRLTKKGDIPSINTLVDIGNLISIRYALPVAVFDTQHIQGMLTVHFADGTESYTQLGSSEATHPEVGEVVFTDEQKLVFARRWCWRQGDQGAAREGTQNVVITMESQHSGAKAIVKKAQGELIDLIREYAGDVSLVSGILDKSRTQIPREV